ncbi:MAG: hypothetical protein UY77_C0009G0023 [Candidatus Uhrbacteria bacterium GW2011_GWA2_53_10]|uniref:Uncharacterized protein n=1 Tax=Candidatus Uhrbacteria bacterium GW2011_GWA2_53_10 TaxID=1618980 RepID=A0A0G1XQ02_9BACT|nr:MAG: hypothetical protein UY77_C0009G0023 [Candidatus Uhrbacteria bacterium GW2011_GWA2_53_10]
MTTHVPLPGAGGPIGEALQKEIAEDVLQGVFRQALAAGAKGEGLVAKVLMQLSKMPDMGVKLAGIVAAGGTEALLGKYLGSDTTAKRVAKTLTADAVLAAFRAAADLNEDGERERVMREQIVSTVRKAEAKPEDRIAYTPGDSKAHRVVLEGGKPILMCREAQKAKDAWEKSHTARVIEAHGKGGKDRPGTKLDAEPFPLEVMSYDLSKERGDDECPVCKPFGKIEDARKAREEAHMATETAGTPTGHAAPAEKKPKPEAIPEWDTKVGIIGQWLLRAFAASLTNIDLGNEAKTVPVVVWTGKAEEVAFDYLKGLPMPATSEEVYALLPRKLNREETKAVVNLIFTAGSGELSDVTKVQQVLAWFASTEEKEKKQEAVDAAQRKLDAAVVSGDIVGKVQAQRELAEAKKAMEPKKRFQGLKWGLVIWLSVSALGMVYLLWAFSNL